MKIRRQQESWLRHSHEGIPKIWAMLWYRKRVGGCCCEEDTATVLPITRPFEGRDTQRCFLLTDETEGERDGEPCPLSSSWWEEELECQPSALNCWAILLPTHRVHVTQLGAMMGTKMTKIYSLPSGKHCWVEMTEHTQKTLIKGGCIWYSVRSAESYGSVGEGKRH